MRLRQSGLRGKARLGHRHHRHGAPDGLGHELTSEEVYELARGGKRRKAQTIFRSMGEALGIALATLVNIFNFPLYLLSGGLLPALGSFCAGDAGGNRSGARSPFAHATTRIEKATLGNEAGLYGAAYLPWVDA